MTCPQCGSEMQDVRATKQHPKAPDFTCTDPTCVNEKGYRTGVWLQPKRAPAAPPVKRTAGGPGMPEAPTVRQPKWTWPTLSETYLQSLLIARKQVVGLATSLKLEVRMEDILAAAATVFIAASRDGVKLIAQSREPEEETADV